MAGSLVWRTYSTDGAVAASLLLDESNAESTAGGTVLMAAFSSAPGLNRLLKPRYVNATLSSNPLLRKRFVIGTQALYNSIGAGGTITEGTGAGALVWNVTSKRGEKARIPTAADTGQVDGDQP